MHLFYRLHDSQTQTQTDTCVWFIMWANILLVWTHLRLLSELRVRCLTLNPRGASRLTADLQPVLTSEVLSCSYWSDFKQIMKYPRKPSDLHWWSLLSLALCRWIMLYQLLSNHSEHLSNCLVTTYNTICLKLQTSFPSVLQFQTNQAQF